MSHEMTGTMKVTDMLEVRLHFHSVFLQQVYLQLGQFPELRTAAVTEMSKNFGPSLENFNTCSRPYNIFLIFNKC